MRKYRSLSIVNFSTVINPMNGLHSMATGAAPSDDETLRLDPKLLLTIDCLEHSGQQGF